MTNEKKNEVPTYDEFYKAVKDDYLKMDDSKTARKYFESAEAQNKIKRDYATNVTEYQAGKISKDVFMKGGVSAVSNCLNLMME